MSLQLKTQLTVDEFLAWAVGRPGRHELLDGEVVSMSPQRARHARAKFRVQTALQAGLAAAKLRCEMLPDGMTVRVDDVTAYEPDALVQCGEPLDDDAVCATNPIIIVEVMSPGTRGIDAGQKLADYFRLPSIQHYLMIDPGKRRLIHHRRGSGDIIETRIASEGWVDLTPPGFSVAVGDLFPET